MKAITLTQPWATLVAIGAKKIETRSWATNYRGPLAIHAAAGLGSVGGMRGLHDLCCGEPFYSVLTAHYCTSPILLPKGAIVAVCELVDCRAAPGYLAAGWEYDDGRIWRLTEQERAFGDYSPGRYAYLLGNVRALPEPIPAKGALGLWNYEGEL